MNWESLFDDLSSQLDSELDAEIRDIALDELRMRHSRMTLRDRIQAVAVTEKIRIQVTSGHEFVLQVVSLGRDWLSADVAYPNGFAHVLIPLRAIVALSFDSVKREKSLAAAELQQFRSPAGRPKTADHIGFSFVLRDLARRRKIVTVHMARTTPINQPGEYHGTIDQVGADHIDIFRSTSRNVDRYRGTSPTAPHQEWDVLPLHLLSFVDLS